MTQIALLHFKYLEILVFRWREGVGEGRGGIAKSVGATMITISFKAKGTQQLVVYYSLNMILIDSLFRLNTFLCFVFYPSKTISSHCHAKCGQNSELPKKNDIWQAEFGIALTETRTRSTDRPFF